MLHNLNFTVSNSHIFDYRSFFIGAISFNFDQVFTGNKLCKQFFFKFKDFKVFLKAVLG